MERSIFIFAISIVMIVMSFAVIPIFVQSMFDNLSEKVTQMLDNRMSEHQLMIDVLKKMVVILNGTK
jgi:cytochrome c oxidase assembly protein Cox11